MPDAFGLVAGAVGKCQTEQANTYSVDIFFGVSHLCLVSAIDRQLGFP